MSFLSSYCIHSCLAQVLANKLGRCWGACSTSSSATSTSTCLWKIYSGTTLCWHLWSSNTHPQQAFHHEVTQLIAMVAHIRSRTPTFPGVKSTTFVAHKSWHATCESPSSNISSSIHSSTPSSAGASYWLDRSNWPMPSKASSLKLGTPEGWSTTGSYWSGKCTSNSPSFSL